jgi:hypothetical protein
MPFLLLRLRKRRAMPALKGKREKKEKPRIFSAAYFLVTFHPISVLNTWNSEPGTWNFSREHD